MRRRVKGLVLHAQARIFLARISSGISFLESDWIDQLRNMMADGGEGSGGDIQGGEGEGEEEEVGGGGGEGEEEEGGGGQGQGGGQGGGGEEGQGGGEEWKESSKQREWA